MKFRIEIRYIIVLTLLPQINRITAWQLLKVLDRHVRSIADLIEFVAAKADTALKESLSVDDFALALNQANSILKCSTDHQINIVSILDDHYPKLLKATDDPPIILSYIGNINILNQNPTICITGTNQPSAFGETFCKYFSTFFSSKAFTIITGINNATERVAHLSAIQANGATCAVLPYGLDVIYLENNKAFMGHLKHGLILSEYYVWTAISEASIMQTERIKAALALEVFVVEFDILKDVLHTIFYAKAYNRYLSCMKPPLQHDGKGIVSGNQMLTRLGYAIGIYDEAELEKLIMFLKRLFLQRNKFNVHALYPLINSCSYKL